MKEAQLNAFFKPSEFTKSCTLSVSGALEFEQGSLDKKDKGENEKKEGKGEKGESKTIDNTAEKTAEKTTEKTTDKTEKEEDKPKKATLKIKGQLSRSE
jgi:hypothetical protein